MKFKIHFYVQLLILIIVYFLLGINYAIVVTLFHFIPSIDYLLTKSKILPNFHRQFFHNLFIMTFALIILYYSKNDLKMLILSGLNFLLHIIMDLGGRGVPIFYPISKFRLKLF